jgi:hypothetical protein
MPIRGHHPHFDVHHDRPISVPFLNRRRGREERKEGVTIAARGGSRMTLDTALPARLKASGRLAHSRYSRRRRLSSQAGSLCDPIGRCLADPSNALAELGRSQVALSRGNSAESQSPERPA